MAMLRRLPAAAVLLVCLLAPASPAWASGADVLKDCANNGRLSKTYTQKEYRQALAQMPADLREYTDCANIIRRAELGINNSGNDPSANAQNPFAGATPEEVTHAQANITAARKSGGAAQRVGPTRAFVTPGALAFSQLRSVSKLPAPLIVLVVVMLLGAAALVSFLVHSRRRREHPADPGA